MSNSTLYKIEVYDVNGVFVDDISDIAAVAPYTRSINSGLETMNLIINMRYNATSAILNGAHEYRIYESRNGGQTQIYSGWLRNVERVLSNGRENEVIASLVGFVGRMTKRLMVGPGNLLNIIRDGTYATDSYQTNNFGGLDTLKSSDMMKFVVNAYRGRAALAYLSYRDSDTSETFGLTRRVGQQFTTSSDAEQCKIAGVRLRMAYSTGTRARIDVGIRGDNGANKPNLTTYGIARLESDVVTATGLNTYTILFDEPITLTASTKYWIYVASVSSSATNTYVWRYGDDNYASHVSAFSTDGGGTWTTRANDMWFEILYVDESRARINYTSTSIDDSGDSKKWTFTNLTCLSAVNYVSRYAPGDWYWYLDETNTFQFHPIGFSASKTLDDCDVTTGWTSGANVTGITPEEDLRIEGAGSVKFTLAGGATTSIIYKDITAVSLSSYRNAGCWIFVPDSTTMANLYVRLYSNSGVNYSQWSINPERITFGAWNWITPIVDINSTPVATSGTLNKAAVDRIAIVIETVSASEASTWYIDNYQSGNTEVSDIVIGRDVLALELKDVNLDDLTNSFILSNNNTTTPITRRYFDDSSITDVDYFESTMVDGRLSDTTTFDEIGNSFIAQNADPKKAISVTIPTYGTSIQHAFLRPGYLVRIIGLDSKLGYNKYFVITSINFDIRQVTINASEIGTVTPGKLSDVERRVDMLESYSATTGNTPRAGITETQI